MEPSITYLGMDGPREAKTPRCVQALRLLDALEWMRAANGYVMIAGGSRGWYGNGVDDVSTTPTEAAEKALERARSEELRDAVRIEELRDAVRIAEKLKAMGVVESTGPPRTFTEAVTLEREKEKRALDKLRYGLIDEPEYRRRTHGEKCQCRDCRSDREAAVAAGQRIRALGSSGTATPGEFAPGSIEIKHGEIPAAALGPEEPRCGVCGGPHVFADHFRDGPRRAEELEKRLKGVGAAMADLSRQALALDAENQKLFDEFHEAREANAVEREKDEAALGPSPHWTAEQEAAIRKRSAADRVREERIAWMGERGNEEARQGTVRVKTGVPLRPDGTPAIVVLSPMDPPPAGQLPEEVETTPSHFYLGAWGVKKEETP